MISSRLDAETNKKQLPPGSDSAISQGCTCNPTVNNHGKGFMNAHTWSVNMDCPLHYFEVREDYRRKKND